MKTFSKLFGKNFHHFHQADNLFIAPISQEICYIRVENRLCNRSVATLSQHEKDFPDPLQKRRLLSLLSCAWRILKGGMLPDQKRDITKRILGKMLQLYWKFYRALNLRCSIQKEFSFKKQQFCL
ncbi:hypothetical protein CEXT_524951 [Caerostris extrusa]|uniref:Uncharacterized protein n=1 Tax=Caerostris extrusa TaxID=172846 RepID=A0AAV4SJZ7_CAEEX|nr:hypothetical protein CEXT_524951 [Caerostris extrusa]